VNGLCLITGINLSGKNAVAAKLQDLWQKENSHIEAHFVSSGSQLMIQHANLSGYHELRALDVPTRRAIREETFRDIVELASYRPVFFLTHFALEDGEVLDHSTLAPATRSVISVVAEAEEIVRRGMDDPDLHHHPGRLRIVEGGVPFVQAYSSNDSRGVFDFVQRASLDMGRGVDLMVVHNNTLDQQDGLLSELLHDIKTSFDGEVAHLEVEHAYAGMHHRF